MRANAFLGSSCTSPFLPTLGSPFLYPSPMSPSYAAPCIHTHAHTRARAHTHAHGPFLSLSGRALHCPRIHACTHARAQVVTSAGHGGVPLKTLKEVLDLTRAQPVGRTSREPKPHTLYNIPCTLYPVPCALYPKPFSRARDAESLRTESCFRHNPEP